MAGSTKTKPATANNQKGKAIVATERAYEILRRVSFARNCPAKAILEELVELLADEAKLASRVKLPLASYIHEID